MRRWAAYIVVDLLEAAVSVITKGRMYGSTTMRNGMKLASV